MNSSNVLITTIIPSYNKIDFLKDAIISVINQSHEKQQILIVNDYPSHDHEEAINKIAQIDSRIKVIHNKNNKGIAGTKNI
jgi:glycosyltransferase involved in cell wall biosynthesis